MTPTRAELCFLIGSGGFAGLGVKLKAVPPGALSEATAKRDTLALDLNSQRWAKAPVIDIKHLAELENPATEQAIYKFYSQPQLPPTGRGTGNAALNPDRPKQTPN